MAGIHFANEDSAGTCRRCGRPLSDPTSIAAGIGPECAEADAADQALIADYPLGADVQVVDVTGDLLPGIVKGYARKRGQIVSLVLHVTDQRGWTYLERRSPEKVQRIEVAS